MRANMNLLKIGFSRITPANITGSGQNFTAYVGLTQIPRVTILLLWAKGTQNGSEKGTCFFCNISL